MKRRVRTTAGMWLAIAIVMLFSSVGGLFIGMLLAIIFGGCCG